MSDSAIEPTGLEEALAKLGRPRILIVGDLMLDRYVMGEVSRISPEAPIPVLAVRGSEERLGGAGNVAANLRSMEAEVEVCGVIGNDGWGKAIRELLEACGADTAALVVDVSRRTIEKTRLVSGVQQMLRVDYEEEVPLGSEVVEGIVKTVQARLDQRAAIDATRVVSVTPGYNTTTIDAVVTTASGDEGMLMVLDDDDDDAGG